MQHCRGERSATRPQSHCPVAITHSQIDSILGEAGSLNILTRARVDEDGVVVEGFVDGEGVAGGGGDNEIGVVVGVVHMGDFHGGVDGSLEAPLVSSHREQAPHK